MDIEEIEIAAGVFTRDEAGRLHPVEPYSCRFAYPDKDGKATVELGLTPHGLRKLAAEFTGRGMDQEALAAIQAAFSLEECEMFPA